MGISLVRSLNTFSQRVQGFALGCHGQCSNTQCDLCRLATIERFSVSQPSLDLHQLRL